MPHSWHIHSCDMISVYSWQASFVTHSFVWHDICLFVTCLIRDTFIRVTWYLFIRDKPHSWHIHSCDMISVYSWQASFVTHSFVWHDICLFVTCLIRDTFIRVTWYLFIRDMPHSWHIHIGNINLLHACVSQVARTHEACHDWADVMPHIWMCHEWGMSRLSRCHATHMNVSRMRHVTIEQMLHVRVCVSRTNVAPMSHFTSEQISHVWMCHTWGMSPCSRCHTCECFTNEANPTSEQTSCRTYKCVTNEACHDWAGVTNEARVSRRHVTHMNVSWVMYRVATCSRLLKIIGLFCKRALWKRRYSAEDTYNFRHEWAHDISHIWICPESCNTYGVATISRLL